MPYTSIRPYFTTALLLLACHLPLQAAEQEHKHEHRQHGAHEHGSAKLLLATEDNQLHIEFKSPAMNIVGFEHAAENSEQIKRISEATALLTNGEKVFALPAAADCKLQDSEVENGQHSPNDKKTAASESHSEFHVTYRYLCGNIQALDHIDVQLFVLFPGTEDIDAEIFTDKGQKAQELSAKDRRIKL